MFLPNLEKWMQTGQFEKILSEFALHCPSDHMLPFAPNFLSFISLRADALPVPEKADEKTQLYIRNIEFIRSYRSNRQTTNPTFVSEAFDFLATHPGEKLTIIEALNHLALSTIEPKSDIAIVTTVRDDGPFLLDWIAHYRAIGIQKFFVFSNDNCDNSDELLSRLNDHGIIVYIRNEMAPTTHPQRKVYQYSVEFLPQLRSYEWSFFLDTDEYFVPSTRFANIQEIIRACDARYGNDKPSAICFHWRWYGGSTLAFESEPVLTEIRPWQARLAR